MFVKSVWMHPSDLGTSDGQLDSVFSRLAKHGFSKIFLFVKMDDGTVTFRTKNPDVQFTMTDWSGDPLEKAVEVAHNYNIEMHPTFVVFCEGIWKDWGVPSQPGAWLSKNLQLVQYDKKGEPILRWADPAKREVRKHESEIMIEVASNYDIDGIQLDYIRYPEDAEGCFCDHCRMTFKGLFGVDPREIAQLDENMSKWIQWRAENITGFVRDLRRDMKKTNPKAELSAAVFKDYPRCLMHLGQDWPKWVEEGIVDFLCPMTYEYDLRVARYHARNHRAAVGKNALLYEGLGKASSQSKLSPREVLAQATAFREEGANGITVFSHGSLTDDDLGGLDKLEG